MEHCAPNPSVNLHKTQRDEPFPKLVLRSNSSPHGRNTLKVNPQISKRHDNRERFLERAQTIKRPFPVELVIPTTSADVIGKAMRTLVRTILSTCPPKQPEIKGDRRLRGIAIGESATPQAVLESGIPVAGGGIGEWE